MPLQPGYQLRELGPSDVEYKYVCTKMTNTLSTRHHTGIRCQSYNILKVSKVLNDNLWRLYRERRNVIYGDMGQQEMVHEIRLFHGSPFAEQIAKEGFDPRFAKETGMFGKGMYFAQHSSKCIQYAYGLNKGCAAHGNMSCYTCPRHMLLCRVAVGKMREMTQADKSGVLPAGFHSIHAVPSAGGLAYPEYVIYDGHQAYPGYLVEYKIVAERSSDSAAADLDM